MAPGAPGQALVLRQPATALVEITGAVPVFVDVTGRRRHRLRWLAYVLGVLGMLYTGLVVFSFLAGPVDPDNVLPFVDSTYRSEQISSAVPTSGRPTVAPSSAAGLVPASTAPPLTSVTAASSSG